MKRFLQRITAQLLVRIYRWARAKPFASPVPRLGLLTASAVLIMLSEPAGAQPAGNETYVEAESGTRSGTRIEQSASGYSGSGS